MERVNYLKLGICVMLGLAWELAPVYAGCEGSFTGATDDSPIFSTMDVTFSPTYSVATTSGTSSCPNWDFTERLEHSRLQFIASERLHIMEEAALGTGRRLEALGTLMGCSPTGSTKLSEVLHAHYQQIRIPLAEHNQSREAINLIKEWMQKHALLKQECHPIS